MNKPLTYADGLGLSGWVVALLSDSPLVIAFGLIAIATGMICTYRHEIKTEK